MCDEEAATHHSGVTVGECSSSPLALLLYSTAVPGAAETDTTSVLVLAALVLAADRYRAVSQMPPPSVPITQISEPSECNKDVRPTFPPGRVFDNNCQTRQRSRVSLGEAERSAPSTAVPRVYGSMGASWTYESESVRVGWTRCPSRMIDQRPGERIVSPERSGG